MRVLTPVGREAFAALALVGHPVASECVAGAGRELAAAGLVRREGDEVSVRHVLLGETAVASLRDSDRLAAHQLASRWVEADGDVARHKAAAGDIDTAYGLALRAARSAVQPGERASHLALAAACRPADDSEELLLEAVEALIDAGDMKAADGLLERVGGDDAETRARVALLRSRTRWETGDNDGARSALDEGVRLTTDRFGHGGVRAH